MSPRRTQSVHQSRTGTPATVTYETAPGSPESSADGASSSGVRHALVVDWDVDLPLEADGHLAPACAQTLQVPNQGQQVPGSITCLPVLDGNIVMGIKVRVELGYKADVELRMFGQTDPTAPFINLYIEGEDVPEFHVTTRQLSPLKQASSESRYTHASILFSFSISAHQDHRPAPAIYESASPAALHRLSNFLDQPGGHDVVFCFPESKHLYADRYILQRCSPYFRRLFQTSHRSDTEQQQHHSSPSSTSSQLQAKPGSPSTPDLKAPSPGLATPRGREGGSDHDTASPRSLGSGDDGFESEDITIQNSEDVQTPGTSAPSTSGENAFPSTTPTAASDPTRVPLPKDSPMSTQKYALQREPSPIVDDNIFVMDIKEASFNTFRAFLYYLYTDFISFAPLTSCFHHVHPFLARSASKTPRSTAEDEAVDKKRLEARNAVVGEYMQRHPGRPVPVSPKSIYAIAKKYEIPALEAQSIMRITSVSETDPIVAVNELFSAFSRVHTPARQVQLATVIANWEQSVRRSGEWEVVRSKGVKVADQYFSSVLCEILDRLP